MFRRVVTDIIQAKFGWLTAGLATLFGFVVHQPSHTFSQYASAHTVSSGGFSDFLWLAALLVFAGGGVAFFYFLSTLPHHVNLDPLNLVHYFAFKSDITPVTRLLYSIVFYVVSVGAYAGLTGTIPALERADTIQHHASYLVDMYSNGGAELGVSAFSYGFLNNPELSFAIQVFVLTVAATALVKSYIKVSEWRILTLLNAGAVLSYFYAHFTGTQVFPMAAKWVFTIQTAVSFGMLVVVTGFLNTTWWVLKKYAKRGSRRTSPTRPNKEEYVIDALFLLIALPVFSPIGSILVWISLKNTITDDQSGLLSESSTPEPAPEPMPGE